MILWQPCQPSSLKALNAVNLFTVVIYDHPAMCCPLLPLLFTPAVRLASLPFPFLIPLPATRRVSLVSPTQLVLGLCDTWHAGWLTYNLNFNTDSLKNTWNTAARGARTRQLEDEACPMPSQGRNQGSLRCCASRATLAVPLWAGFLLFEFENEKMLGLLLRRY